MVKFRRYAKAALKKLLDPEALREVKAESQMREIHVASSEATTFASRVVFIESSVTKDVSIMSDTAAAAADANQTESRP